MRRRGLGEEERTDKQEGPQHWRDREVKRALDPQTPPGGMGSEAGILLLLLLAGITGMITQSPAVTFAVFIGGGAMWFAITFPSYIRQQQAAKHAKMEEEAAAAKKQGDGGGDAAAPGPKLPSPEQVMALIKARRAVYPKDYSGERVTRAELEQVVEAAIWAPNHGLSEPWKLVALEGSSKAAMEDLTVELCRTRLPAEKAAEVVEKLEKKRVATWGKTSAYIAICCRRTPGRGGKLMPEWEDMAAVAAGAQNMWLMATALGLAAYWTSWQEVARDAPEMKALLGLGEADRVMGFLTLGRSERLAAYRGSRTPWQEKAVFKD